MIKNKAETAEHLQGFLADQQKHKIDQIGEQSFAEHFGCHVTVPVNFVSFGCGGRQTNHSYARHAERNLTSVLKKLLPGGRIHVAGGDVVDRQSGGWLGALAGQTVLAGIWYHGVVVQLPVRFVMVKRGLPGDHN